MVMINNGAAYISFVVVVVVLLCLGAWLRQRRIKALIARRHQEELEARLGNNSGSGGRAGVLGANAYSWMNGGTTGLMRPVHAYLRQPRAHVHSPAIDTKPDDYLPQYSQPMPNQPPPYAPSPSTELPAQTNARGNHSQ
ncbi:hypothetical protein GGF42_002122 [Coemansia sp. RSA 2424]|nr:hypothetical protein GGF42_002122 [Coemansia sp. RSA 2424]